MAVPIKFLRTYAALRPPLTHGEALFILHLMTFKWDEACRIHRTKPSPV